MRKIGNYKVCFPIIFQKNYKIGGYPGKIVTKVQMPKNVIKWRFVIIFHHMGCFWHVFATFSGQNTTKLGLHRNNPPYLPSKNPPWGQTDWNFFMRFFNKVRKWTRNDYLKGFWPGWSRCFWNFDKFDRGGGRLV